jgi:hypothetical protein
MAHREVLMRWVVGSALFLGLLAVQLTASAQGDDSGEAAESADRHPEKDLACFVMSVLPLGASAQAQRGSGVNPYAAAPFGADYETPGEMERRMQRAKIGVGVSVAPILAGGILMLASAVPYAWEGDKARRLAIGGVVLMTGGAASMIATGILLGVRKRKLRESKEATDRKVRWDLAQSRIIF